MHFWEQSLFKKPVTLTSGARKQVRGCDAKGWCCPLWWRAAGSNNLFTPLRCIQGKASDDGLRQLELSYHSGVSGDFGPVSFMGSKWPGDAVCSVKAKKTMLRCTVAEFKNLLPLCWWKLGALSSQGCKWKWFWIPFLHQGTEIPIVSLYMGCFGCCLSSSPTRYTVRWLNCDLAVCLRYIYLSWLCRGSFSSSLLQFVVCCVLIRQQK